MNPRGGTPPELFCWSCLLVLSVACLAMIFVFVSGRCGEIFMSGGECGIGYGWFGIAGGFFGIGRVAGVPAR
jgi:hypothetical protein